MKVNQHTALSTSKVTLVPYSVHHVPTYHAWMQDPELQAATASEPLTLAEEYDMQRSWRNDQDKLTFIVCLPIYSRSPEKSPQIVGGTVDAPDRMIGDINLFLFHPEDEDDTAAEADSSADGQSNLQGVVGEIELMIARCDVHRQGYGRAALLAFLCYILTSWTQISSEYSSESPQVKPLNYLRVKINQDNARSIALFKSIGFQATEQGANYFGEIEMRWQPEYGQLEGAKGWEQFTNLAYLEPL